MGRPFGANCNKLRHIYLASVQLIGRVWAPSSILGRIQIKCIKTVSVYGNSGVADYTAELVTQLDTCVSNMTRYVIQTCTFSRYIK